MAIMISSCTAVWPLAISNEHGGVFGRWTKLFGELMVEMNGHGDLGDQFMGRVVVARCPCSWRSVPKEYKKCHIFAHTSF